MSINSREDLNNYYEIFNDLVDEYTETWKIKPSNLKRYLKPNSERFNKFLEKSKTKIKTKFGLDLDHIYGKQVLQNVIEDRCSMEQDGVLNFNKFQLFESVDYKIDSLTICLTKGVNPADSFYEKFLADFYDTNLSQIDFVDRVDSVDYLSSIAGSKHFFRVKGWDVDKEVILWSNDEYEVISQNLKEFLFNQLQSKSVDVVGLELEIGDCVDKTVFLKKLDDLLVPNLVVKVISNCLSGFEYEPVSTQHGYHLWSRHVTS